MAPSTCCLPGCTLTGSWIRRASTQTQALDMGCGHPKWYINQYAKCLLCLIHHFNNLFRSQGFSVPLLRHPSCQLFSLMTRTWLSKYSDISRCRVIYSHSKEKRYLLLSLLPSMYEDEEKKDTKTVRTRESQGVSTQSPNILIKLRVQLL